MPAPSGNPIPELLALLEEGDAVAARFDAYLSEQERRAVEAAARAEPHIAANHTCMRAGDHCAACEEFEGAVIEIEKRERDRDRIR